MVKIAVASGKGGTGKSTISTNLAYILSKEFDNVVLGDCDVEEPNCHIFLNPEFTSSKKIYLSVPKIDSDKCVACGKCVDVCQFNVLALVKEKVMVFPELCHSCGGCWLACPVGAISQDKRKVGEVEIGKGNNINFIQGKSRIGEAMSPPLIKEVKKAAKDFDIQILDSPPGTSCPVIAAVDGVDYIVLVTEPTPFGLYDLRLAVDVMKKLGKHFGIVINRSSENDYLIEDYAKKENAEILAKIADDRSIAECYSKGKLILEELPHYKEAFMPIVDKIRGLL